MPRPALRRAARQPRCPGRATVPLPSFIPFPSESPCKAGTAIPVLHNEAKVQSSLSIFEDTQLTGGRADFLTPDTMPSVGTLVLGLSGGRGQD